uniref:Glycerol-3-phosphate acyltransferase 3 n=1 Tax=Aceria tosichella TaxID=561515 RepID=A0A6G1S8F1_9ACAR
MFRMLDLILKTAKCCLVLTIVRLLTSAFGYEFGISRQYLRLLEWILRQGKERIERCESEQRLQFELEAEPGRRPSSEQPPTNTVDGGAAGHRSNCEMTETNGIETAAKRPKRLDLHGEDSMAVATADNQQKRRRVSTPNGPPIFLFDVEDDDEYNDVEETEQLPNRNGPEGPIKQHEFHLEDVARLVARGISAIIDDEVTKRFTHEQLKTWNLLTRTNAKNYQFMSRSLGFWWFAGLVVRYSILMPLRIMFTLTGFVWLVLTMPIIGFLPKLVRDKPHRLVSLMAFRMLSCGINSRLKFHNREYRAQGGSICVANHTSPLDVVLLASDNCYTLVGQRHGGLLGLLQFALSRAANHIWFERSEMRDRQFVAARLKEHVDISSNLPVLIFPEGTCINNSAVMMFRKGSFEVTDRIHPIAIKYDPRFGDPFWNSSKQTYVQYLLMIMSTWAIKCDVWYLKPMDRLQDEDSAEFANRVKAEIAKQAGLENLAWDGQLKRSSVKPTWLFQQQEDYVRRLKLE